MGQQPYTQSQSSHQLFFVSAPRPWGQTHGQLSDEGHWFCLWVSWTTRVEDGERQMHIPVCSVCFQIVIVSSSVSLLFHFHARLPFSFLALLCSSPTPDTEAYPCLTKSHHYTRNNMTLKTSDSLMKHQIISSIWSSLSA